MHGRTHIFGAKCPKNEEKAGFIPGFSSLKNPRRDFLEISLCENPEANYSNTTITLICSRTPRKFIWEHKEYFTETCPGHFIGNYGMYKIHIINIETIRLSGPDGVFLSEFCRNIDRLSDQTEIKESGFPKQIIDKLLKGMLPSKKLFWRVAGCMDAPAFLGCNAPKMEKKPDSFRVFRL